MTTVKNIYDYIDSVAPYSTQEEWDNSGHLIGDFRAEVKKVVLALDATKQVCDFARDVSADLVLTHHPIIFGGINDVKDGTSVYSLASSGIACLCAHTNLDLAVGGINDKLADILSLGNARHIDDLPIVCGTLDNDMSMDDFAEYVASRLNVSGIRYTDTDHTIRTVAVGGGACEEYVDIAMRYADCFVTGDMKYHDMLDCSEKGYAVISAGHYETECAPFLAFCENLISMFPDVEFVVAPVSNPIKSVC